MTAVLIIHVKLDGYGGGISARVCKPFVVYAEVEYGIDVGRYARQIHDIIRHSERNAVHRKGCGADCDRRNVGKVGAFNTVDIAVGIDGEFLDLIARHCGKHAFDIKAGAVGYGIRVRAAGELAAERYSVNEHGVNAVLQRIVVCVVTFGQGSNGHLDRIIAASLAHHGYGSIVTRAYDKVFGYTARQDIRDVFAVGVEHAHVELVFVIFGRFAAVEEYGGIQRLRREDVRSDDYPLLRRFFTYLVVAVARGESKLVRAGIYDFAFNERAARRHGVGYFRVVARDKSRNGVIGAERFLIISDVRVIERERKALLSYRVSNIRACACVVTRSAVIGIHDNICTDVAQIGSYIALFHAVLIVSGGYFELFFNRRAVRTLHGISEVGYHLAVIRNFDGSVFRDYVYDHLSDDQAFVYGKRCRLEVALFGQGHRHVIFTCVYRRGSGTVIGIFEQIL